MSRRSRGFTLVELVVSIAISSVVVLFATMFMTAPVDAYQAQSRRAVMVGDASAAWPRMRDDLRESLPNSLRVRRNGNFMVIEMLAVQGASRYMTAMGGSFTAAGTVNGLFTNLPINVNVNNIYYLSVNNLGTPGADAYALTGSMTAVRPQITYATNAAGEGTVTVNPAPAFAADSPRRRVYLVTGPVTYLCDETQGTLRRYSGYAVTANQALRDAPTEFGGAANSLVARGLTSCNFAASAVNPTRAQTASVRLTTTRNNESVTMLHSSRAEYLP